MKRKYNSNPHCICVTCGTTDQDQESGFCINGHDDWLEYLDIINAELGDKDSKRFVKRAEKKLKMQREDMLDIMKGGYCL